MVLADGHSNSKVIVSQVRSKVLIGQYNIYAYNGVLGILGPLEQEVDIDVLNALKLRLTCLDLPVILVILRYLGSSLGLDWGLRVGLPTLGSCSLGIGFGWRRCLSRRCSLLLFLLLVLIFGLLGDPSQLGLLPELLQLNLQVSRVKILGDLLEPIRYVGSLVGAHQYVHSG